MSIYITRGDIATLEISANLTEDEAYTFKVGDVVRFKVFEKKNHSSVVLSKDLLIESETALAAIYLHSSDTRIGPVIDKPVNYWYEVEINPDTAPQTIIGYDTNGPKIFRLFPEGGDDDE